MIHCIFFYHRIIAAATSAAVMFFFSRDNLQPGSKSVFQGTTG